jgi:hypothetical protein
VIRLGLAVVAAAWFAYNAFTFLPTPFVHLNDGQVGGIDGDAGAVAVTWAARALFGGLAILALAIPDWDSGLRALGGTRPDDVSHDIRER